MAASSSSSSLDVTQPQVFINFRGKDMRTGFVDYLVHEMKKEDINVFIDKHEVRGMDLQDLLVRIEESTVAIALFSKNYTSSDWCLNELAKIKDCVDRGTLLVIPIFYRIKPSVIKGLEGDFGFAFRNLIKHVNRHPVTDKWEEAIVSITQKHGMELPEHDHKPDRVFITEMITEVKRLLEHIKKKADQRGQLKTIQNIQSEAVQVIRQPEAVQKRQPEAVKIQQQNVNYQGFMFNARKLKINNSHNARHWTFVSISESPNEAAIAIAKMVICYDLKVWGEFYARELTFGKRYEVVFVVKVDDTMSRFHILAKTQLMVPEKELQEQELQFVDLIKKPVD